MTQFVIMATIKSYTDIEQSRKLAEFLPPESADVIWDLTNPDLPTIRAIPYEDSDYNNKYLNIIAAWSLTALLGVLPNYQLQTQDDGIGVLCSCNGKFNIVTANNPVNACVAMIESLHELNLL